MAYYDTAQHHGDTGHALFDLAARGHFVTDAGAHLLKLVRDSFTASARFECLP